MNGDVKTLAAKEGVTTCIIVDDAFDPPMAARFAQYVDTVLSHVVNDEDKARLYAAVGVPAGNVGEFREAVEQDAAVQRLADAVKTWPAGDARTELERVFDQTSTAQQGERERLASLIKTLESQNIKCLTEGTVGAKTGQAELLFVDLYLGSHPDVKAATAAAVEKIRSLRTRYTSEKPQLVVLMSNRGAELQKAFASFWQDAGLFGGQLRSLDKFNLTDETAVLDATFDLLSNRARVEAVDTFVTRSDAALRGALEKFRATIRRLDVSDYVDIKELVLDAEGLPLSEYLTEIYSTYLISLFEADDAVQRALRALDQEVWTSENYPPNEFEPSAEAVKLMDGLTFHAAAMLRNDASGLPADFQSLRLGDVLFKAAAEGPMLWLVMVQDCDIIREKTKFALLIPGVLADITATRPLEKRGKVPVPIQLGEERRLVWWDTNDAEPLGADAYSSKIRNAGFQRIRRMRLPWALKLQRMVLDQLGRVPTATHMHGRMEAKIRIYVKGSDNRWRRVEGGTDISAFVLIGRIPDGKPNPGENMRRLALPNPSFDRLCYEIVKSNTAGAVQDVKTWVDGFDSKKRRLLRTAIDALKGEPSGQRELKGDLDGLAFRETYLDVDLSNDKTNGKCFLVQIMMGNAPAPAPAEPQPAPAAPA